MICNSFYFCTVKEVYIAGRYTDTVELNQLEYVKVGAGVALAIWRSQKDSAQLTRFVPFTNLSEYPDLKKPK